MTRNTMRAAVGRGALAVALLFGAVPAMAQDDAGGRGWGQRPGAEASERARGPRSGGDWRDPAGGRAVRGTEPDTRFEMPTRAEQAAQAPARAMPDRSFGTRGAPAYTTPRDTSYGLDRAARGGAQADGRMQRGGGWQGRDSPRSEARTGGRTDGRGGWQQRQDGVTVHRGDGGRQDGWRENRGRGDGRGEARDGRWQQQDGWRGDRDDARRDDRWSDNRYGNGRYGDGRYENGRYDNNRYGNGRYGTGGAYDNRYGSGYGRDRGSHRQWDNRSWRRDSRYDWYGYRSANRQLFSLGRYYAPYRGYSYNRLGIGFTLGSLFYSNRYWISDPWRYRLPAVYGPYRWVRYYNDALLVDTYSGQVVDAIYDVFW